MTDDSGRRAMRRDLVPTTARLIEFLRDLALQGQPRIRDAHDHEQVLWLADLPPGIIPFQDARFGDVIISCDPIAAEPPPELPAGLVGWLSDKDYRDSSLDAPPMRGEGPRRGGSLDAASSHIDETSLTRLEDAPGVLSAYRSWLPRWQAWAEADQRTTVQRDWFNRLTSIAHRLSQQDDEFEVVLATGYLSWATPSGKRVASHLLTTRLKAVTDRDTGRVDLTVDPDAYTRLEDRDLLDGEDGFAPTRTEALRERLRTAAPPPLGDESKELLERWQTLTLPGCRPYQHVWKPPDSVTNTAELCFAPAVVLRKRDRSSLIGYYDRMLEVLNGPDAVAPLGLAQLVTTLEPEERLAWLGEEALRGAAISADPLFPLPANPEQRQIMQRLMVDNGVVVHGPPGTGKTHTIANLISALLAQGLRVLVTSEKGQALRVLLEKLPQEIQQLCVLMTEQKRG